MEAILWFLLLLICFVNSASIWDPECATKECPGDPDRGDGVNSFDDWDGTTKTYSTKITYTCADGLGFDTTGSPAKIESFCGKKCNGFNTENVHRCYYSGGVDPAECRNSDPEWDHEGGQLPGCTVGKN